jgi:glycosyltransferase involved in cell wall biosynthesis
MAFMYNIADVTINIASNEGFGLSGAESIMCGTPILNNITGGLQDHCGFKLNDKFLTADDYVALGSLHDDIKWKNNPDLTWGEWVEPVWPSNRSIQGSPETPYIFDDRARFDDVAVAIGKWYKAGKSERDRRGALGRGYAMSEDGQLSSKAMADNFIKGIESTFTNWKKRKRFTLYKI